jgi:serine/threonine-protein kinase
MSFWGELKRRKVFQVATVYAVTAWILVQVIVSIEAPLQLPAWTDTFVIVLLAIGFPVALVLSWAFDVTPHGIRATRGTERAGGSPQPAATMFTYLSHGLVLLAVGFLVIDQYLDLGTAGSSREAPTDVIRYHYGLAEPERLLSSYGLSIAVSPDGSRITYVGPAEGGTQLWIRERERLRSTPVPHSEGALQPFFSPDGRGVGFVSDDRELKVIPTIGDPPLTLVDGGLNPFGGTWAEDGHVYYSTSDGLMRQKASGGGEPEAVAAASSAGPEVYGYAWPDVLPNATGAVFTIFRNHVASDIAVVDFATGRVRILVEGELGLYAESGHLVYAREGGQLMAAPFDQDALALTAPAVLLPDQIPAGTPTPDLAVSKSGRLLYATRPRRTLEAVWVDREGAWVPVDPDNAIEGIRYLALSPDDTALAVTTWLRPSGDDGQIWVKHLPDGPYSRLTFRGDVNFRPSWSPDGRSVVFVSDRDGKRDVWMKRVDGTKEAELILEAPMAIDEAFYSSNGQWIVHRRGMEDGQRDIYAMATDADAEPRPLVVSDFDEVAPALSPDRRWLAYVSDRSGEPNVYVRPFPDADTETRVSVNGGMEPVWGRSRPELYYRNGVADMVAVPVLAGPEFKTAAEEILFASTAYLRDFYHATYDVTVDGERFVMIRVSDSGSLDEELVVVENWFEELNRLVPAS